MVKSLHNRQLCVIQVASSVKPAILIDTQAGMELSKGMGDGESVVSFPSTFLCQSSGRDVHWIEDIGPILEALSQMTWKEWGLYRQYVIGGGLIRDWLEQVA